MWRALTSPCACVCACAASGSARRAALSQGDAEAAGLTSGGASPCPLSPHRPGQRLRPQRACSTAGRPIWAKPPQVRSNERRGPHERTCARAAGPDFLRQRPAAAARIQRARGDAQRPRPARLVKTSLKRPVSKGCGGPTSGLPSARRWRVIPRNEATLASGRAAGRAVALLKGGSPGSLGRWVAERARERPQKANPQRHGRAAWLFRAGRGQPQRGASTGPEPAPSDG